MLYAYQSGKFLRSVLIEVLRENGEIVNVYEFFSKKAAEKLLSQWFEKEGGISWIEGRYWDSAVYQARNDLQRLWGFEV